MVLSSGEPSLPFTEWNKDSGSNKMDDVQDLDSSWEEEDAEPMGEDDILSFSRNEEKVSLQKKITSLKLILLSQLQVMQIYVNERN